jgi:hypothetical protein
VTSESTNAAETTGPAVDAGQSEDGFQTAYDELVARQSELEWIISTTCINPDPWEMALAFALGNFSLAFIQALGQRAADGTAKLPKKVADLVQKRVRKKGKPDEYQVGVNDGSAATIVVTEDLPDEARLALLDLDITADDLLGKLLRWDADAEAWLPSDDK